MYRWLVFLHVLSVFGFLLAHGAAAAISFKLRGEREVERVRALLDLSTSARAVASTSLLVLLAVGIVLSFMDNWWGHAWIWASLGLLVLIGIAMTMLGTRSLDPVRQLVDPARAKQADHRPAPAPEATVEQQLAVVLAATHPWLLAAIGGGGLALILWLMMFKPF